MKARTNMSLSVISVLALLSTLVNSWQFPGTDHTMLTRPHKWEDARKLMGPRLSYSALERDMQIINPKTLTLLRVYGCPIQNYIDKMYIDVNTHNSYMIRVDCSGGPRWFLYNGVMSGRISLDMVYDKNPLQNGGPEYHIPK